MCWRLIIEKFGPNIQHIAGVDNIVADTLSGMPYVSSNNSEPFTEKDQCRANEFFAIGREENNEMFFPLNLLILQI